MKKLLILFLLLVLLAGSAAADPIDLSDMSFDELVALRDQLNLAIWNSQEWQEVTVPAGVYRIGKDIPAGHWSVTLTGECLTTTIYYFQYLDAPGLSFDASGYFYFTILATPDMADLGFKQSNTIDIIMSDNWYFKCDDSVVFTPFTGKPILDFH